MSSRTEKAVQQKFAEHQLAHELLDGQRGLEIGASAHNSFGLDARNVAPRDDFDSYAKESHRIFGLEPAPIDIWAYAWNIPVPDQSEDFIISSHVIEHLPDLITTFIEWNRIIRDSGYVFLIAPLKGALPEDQPRELTPLEHFIEDYKQNRSLDTHSIEGVPGGRMGHYHTFAPETVIAIVDYMHAELLCDWRLIAREDVDTKVGNGFTLVFQVSQNRQAVFRQLEVQHKAQPGDLMALTGPDTEQNTVAIFSRTIGLRQEIDSLREEADRMSAQADFSAVELKRYENEIGEYRKRVAEYERSMAQILNSETYSIGAALWRMRVALVPQGTLRERAMKAVLRFISNSRESDIYSAWIAENEPSELELNAQKSAALNFSYRPLISILTPVYDTPPELLKATIESVLNQTYDQWELCIAEGKSEGAELQELLQHYAHKDSRIRVKFLDRNLGISGNSNESLQLAEGEFIALLDHDDLLAPSALFEVARLLNSDPTIDFIYSDRDMISEDGTRRYDPFFKPDWSPEIMLCANYLTHLNVIRKEMALKIGGFNSNTDGAQDWDFFLRLTEQTNRIAHIPRMLYHWRSWRESAAQSMEAKPYAREAQRQAISAHLRRQGLEPEVLLAPGNLLRAKWRVSGNTKVSVVIPLDRSATREARLDSVFANTSNQNIEVIVVTSAPLGDSNRSENIRFVHCAEQLNRAQMNNLAASAATGNALLFLSNGLQPITIDWLEEMTRWIERPAIGIAGAKILKRDYSIEHAGLLVDTERRPCSLFASRAVQGAGLYGSTEWYRNFLAVSGDCLMIRADLFKEVGGFDEHSLASDVELCLRVREKGLRIVYTPFAVFKRIESRTEDRNRSLTFINGRKFTDPYYNSNIGSILRNRNGG